MPFSLSTPFWQEARFWIGLFFVAFPLNYLVYGLNDYNDYQADAVNQRKGNFLFGAQSSSTQLQAVPLKVTLINLPFLVYFSVVSGWLMVLVLAFMIVVNLMYNFKPFRIKERPPLEILIQTGYVMTAIFCVILNDLPMLPWQTLVYLTLFAFQAHIAGEIMDIEPDIISGKKTTATLLGRIKTKWIMFSILLIETFLLIYWFNDYILSGFLALFSVWLLLDILVFFKEKPYSVKQMKLFGFAMNICAFLSMAWILYSGKLLAQVF